MTNTKRWLDELPLESHERELLLVGKSARPAEGALDANWQALCVTLGTTAAVSGVVASNAATHSISASASASASAKVGSSLVASKLAGAGLLVAVAKSLAVGVAVGLALMGAGSVVEHLSASNERHPNIAKPSPTIAERQPSAESVSPTIAPQPDKLAIASAAPLSGASAVFPPPREHIAAANPALNPASAPLPLSTASPASTQDKAASLSQQARELAELKRLIDSGATSEALRRLDKGFSPGTDSVLSEERDALYVQALARAQRRAEARVFAQRFLVRYPRSPYSETMRQLLAEE